MALTFKKISTYDYKKHRITKSWEPTIVQPGQALSLKEIIANHIHGRQMKPYEYPGPDPDAEVGFDDYNPLEYTVDELTEMDKMKSEVITLNDKFKKASEAKKKEDEAKSKEVNESKAVVNDGESNESDVK